MRKALDCLHDGFHTLVRVSRVCTATCAPSDLHVVHAAHEYMQRQIARVKRRGRRRELLSMASTCDQLSAFFADQAKELHERRERPE